MTRKAYVPPKPFPSVTDIGLNNHKADRILQIERLSNAAYSHAAKKANRPENFVVAESHHFRYKYPHTLGRMKHYKAVKAGGQIRADGGRATPKHYVRAHGT